MKDENAIFTHMRAVQREAKRSQIPVYKIAALIDGKDPMGHEFTVMRCNHWPNIIRERIGVKNKIGNSSPSIHAETAVLTVAPHAVQGTDLYVTDPMCPNCMKNIAEAQIARLFIGKEGFERKFYRKNKKDVDTISMEIAKRAGISVYSVDILKENIDTLFKAPENYNPPNDSPVEIEPIDSESEAIFDDVIERASKIHKQRKHAIALVKDNMNNKYALIARSHMVVGYTAGDAQDAALISKAPGEKYSLIQEPINRLLMFIAAKGYKLLENYLYCSIVPTSREQVNLVGANIKRITVGDFQKSRDSCGLEAMHVLSDAKILEYT
jgi:dCMP deaminase